jgi:hypothetical protein
VCDYVWCAECEQAKWERIIQSLDATQAPTAPLGG